MWTDANRIKLYCYYFHGIEKPVVIEAYNKVQARDMMKTVMPTLPKEYKESIIVGETVKSPVYGVSEKTINGVRHLWAGKHGWQPESKFSKSKDD